MLSKGRIDISCENHTERNECARNSVTMTDHVVGIYFREGNTDSCNLPDHYYANSRPSLPCQVSGTAEVMSAIVIK